MNKLNLNNNNQAGKFYGVGLGPGDPELLTLKAVKAIETADVIAYHQAAGKNSHALQIAQQFLHAEQHHLPLIYPLTKEVPVESQIYQAKMQAFYEDIAKKIAALLDQGKNVSVLVAGDPLLYSSFMPLYQRLGSSYETIIIPGVTSAMGAAAALKQPLVSGNMSFTILSGLLSEEQLQQKLKTGDAFVILKLGGGHFDKVRRCLRATRRDRQASYIEYATMKRQKILPLDDVEADKVPYFSLILVRT